MRGLRVLVTGPTGFVGPYLARGLRAAGAGVHGVGLGSAEALLAEGALEGWHACDVMDLDTLSRTVTEVRPDAIVHLAGQSSTAFSLDHPLETYRINGLGCFHVLEAARHHAPRARVLIVGTSETYGTQPEGTRVPEGAPLRPMSPYALSKAIADAAADYYARVHGMDIIRTRSFSHIGPGQQSVFVVPGLARQIAAIEAGSAEPVVRVGNLDVTRDITDVRDVAEAYVAILERGRPGSAYNVCRGEGVRLAEIVDRLCAHARVAVRIEVDPARVRPVDVPYLVGDPTAIHRDTGWRPTRPVNDVLGEVLEEWRRRAPGP